MRIGQNRLMKEKETYVGSHKDRQAGLGRDRTGGGKNRTEQDRMETGRGPDWTA